MSTINNYKYTPSASLNFTPAGWKGLLDSHSFVGHSNNLVSWRRSDGWTCLLLQDKWKIRIGLAPTTILLFVDFTPTFKKWVWANLPMRFGSKKLQELNLDYPWLELGTASLCPSPIFHEPMTWNSHPLTTLEWSHIFTHSAPQHYTVAIPHTSIHTFRINIISVLSLALVQLPNVPAECMVYIIPCWGTKARSKRT